MRIKNTLFLLVLFIIYVFLEQAVWHRTQPIKTIPVSSSYLIYVKPYICLLLSINKVDTFIANKA